MPNRLADETSPYLLQHAHNPVDWYPWGGEAFQKARSEDKPIFLSIGYSACHWCHVMERESFENQSIAALLNEQFVSVKVDREERPDVDSIYMTAVQMISGQGGWPMSMFLTPDGSPFWGGTYFPPEDRYGRPGFPRVLTALADAWRIDREKLLESAAHVVDALQSTPVGDEEDRLTAAGREKAAHAVARGFDATHGGFGDAPKFPPSMTLEFLLELGHGRGDESLMHIVTFTLRRMGRGGMFDQIGGGFHRYSVDERWLVPHFEKMLYDNALLARLYVHGWQATGDPEFQRIARETLDWVLREMTAPAGGFYSSLDADSEGEEGKFYVWSREEVIRTLGEDEGTIFCALYDITSEGNFEGHNIPNLPRDPQEVAQSLGISVDALQEIASRGRCKLFGVRATRVHPGRDEKVLTAWNGWMLAAFAEAALAFGDERYLTAVRNNVDFLLDNMISGDRVLRSWKDGRARIAGVLEDYAGAAWGLLLAFEATGDRRCLDTARVLGRAIIDRFRGSSGEFFDTPSDGEPLITRPRDIFDNATPSGTSLAAEVLARLAIWFDDPEFRRASEAAITSSAPMAERYPSGFGFLMSAAGWHLGSPVEVVLTGEDDAVRAPLLRTIGETYLAHRVLLTSTEPDLPLMQGREPERSAAWVCRNYACRAPVSTPEALRSALNAE